jgi:hypothetical protein
MENLRSHLKDHQGLQKAVGPQHTAEGLPQYADCSTQRGSKFFKREH